MALEIDAVVKGYASKITFCICISFSVKSTSASQKKKQKEEKRREVFLS